MKNKYFSYRGLEFDLLLHHDQVTVKFDILLGVIE